ncbi:MAG: hypothetical protein FWF60_02130 [Oscillospiraceae bacterium]|nr:hypothetical protein [Oscillospiraceae bacterium]
MKKQENPLAALSPHGRAFVREVDRLAGEVLAPEGPAPAPMTARQARDMRRAAGAFYCAAVVLSLLLGTALLLNAFSDKGVLGMRFFVEPTNAMRGLVPRGSLLITVTRGSSRIKPGDIITYYALYEDKDHLKGMPGARLTRIVDECLNKDGELLRFRTKRAGDAAPDSMEVNITHVLGVKLAVLPGMGYAVSFLQAYAGGLAVLAAALLISAVALRRWANMEHPRGKRRKKRKGRAPHAIA